MEYMDILAFKGRIQTVQSPHARPAGSWNGCQVATQHYYEENWLEKKLQFYKMHKKCLVLILKKRGTLNTDYCELFVNQDSVCQQLSQLGKTVDT